MVIRPIDVQHSSFWTIVEPDKAVRLGYHCIQGIGSSQEALLSTELARGPFLDLPDLIQRTRLSRSLLEKMAMAGVFTSWYPQRRMALWHLHAEYEHVTQGPLRQAMSVTENDIPIKTLVPPEVTLWDLQTTHLSPTHHPFEHLCPQLLTEQLLPLTHIATLPHGSRVRATGLVITRQRLGTAKGIVLLTLEDETGHLNVIVRPALYEQERRCIHENPALLIMGCA